MYKTMKLLFHLSLSKSLFKEKKKHLPWKQICLDTFGVLCSTFQATLYK